MSMYIPSVGEAARKIVKYYEEGAIDDLNAVGELKTESELQQNTGEEQRGTTTNQSW